MRWRLYGKRYCIHKVVASAAPAIRSSLFYETTKVKRLRVEQIKDERLGGGLDIHFCVHTHTKMNVKRMGRRQKENMPIKTLVLSSASANFPLLLGRLHAIREDLKSLCHIVGTSAGGIIGVLMAAGYSARQMFDLAADRKLAQETLLRANPFNMVFATHLIDNDWIRDLFSRLLVDKGFAADITLGQFAEQTGVRISVAVFNISTCQPAAFDSTDTPSVGLVDAMLATSAIPFLLPPIQCNDNQWYCDGALTHFFPAHLFPNLDVATTLGIVVLCQVPAGQVDVRQWKWIVQVLFCAANFLQYNTFSPPPFKIMVVRQTMLPFSVFPDEEMFNRGAGRA